MTGKLAGTIGQGNTKKQILTPEQLHAKIEQFRVGMFKVEECLFDNGRQQLIYRAKHPHLVGTEVTVGVDLASALFTMANIIPVHVIPVLNGQITVTRKGEALNQPAPEEPPEPTPPDMLAEISALLRKMHAAYDPKSELGAEALGMADRIDVRISATTPAPAAAPIVKVD